MDSPLGKSDHCVLKISFKCKAETRAQPKIRYKYDKGNYTKMKDLFKKDWNAEFKDCPDNVEKQWEIFLAKCKDAEEKCIPKKKIRASNRRFTVPLEKAALSKIKKKHRLWQRFLQTEDGQVYNEYCQIRNQVRRITRKAQKEFEKTLAKQVKTNPKKFWNYAGSKSKVKVGVPNLSKSGDEKGKDLTENDMEKAEVLSEFFTSVFTREPDGSWDLPEPIKAGHKLELEITKESVLKILNKLKISKSPGPDALHPRILFEIRDEICEPLSIIFNTSLRTGVVPQDWKSANITAIYKKGSKKIAGNYRPISLTCIVCKLMETLVRNSLVEYMKKNNLFSNQQYGFISGRSTVLQLIRVLDRWTEILDKGGSIDVIYCDFMKAFDKVPHRRLIEKLEYYGIGDPLLSWIRAFLSNRKQ
jgi:hypothetical protein